MQELPKDNWYRKTLVSLMNDINEDVPLEMEDRVLAVMVLNTEEKI